MRLGGIDEAVRRRYGLARWRIDSPVERLLAAKADSSGFWKSAYVLYYRIFDREYYRKGRPYLRKACEQFLGTAEPDPALVNDMVYSPHRFGCTFDEYFLLGYGDLNADGRSRFLTDKLRYEVYCRCNDDSAREVLNDKSETFRVFGRYFGRDVVTVTDEKDYKRLTDFAHHHEDFFVKPLKGQCGRGATICRGISSNEAKSLIGDIAAAGGALLESLIRQSDEMAAFHPESVNTVRMPVFRIGGGVRRGFSMPSHGARRLDCRQRGARRDNCRYRF